MSKLRKVLIMKGDGRPLIVRKQGRNALCYCGSGKKAKHCCGENEEFFVKKNSIDRLTDQAKQENRI